MPRRMNRSVKKARLSATLSLTRDGDYASTGVEGVVHHFIAEASQNIHRLRFSPPENSTASLIGKRTTVDEERKRKRERERDRRGRDIWHGSTWLVSHLLTIFVLTVFVEGTYLYVGPWTYFLYTYSCIISVYMFSHSSAGEHYHCRNVSLYFFIFLVFFSSLLSCNES